MKIVAWGTGAYASNVIDYNWIWMQNVEFVCFVNNKHKKGVKEAFRGVEILSPGELSGIEYDYIIILSTFVEEITEQIVHELYIAPDRIITVEKMAQLIVEKLHCSIIGKNVVLYGNQYEKYQYIYHVQRRVSRLSVVGDDNCRYHGVNTYKVTELKNQMFDYILLLDYDIDEERQFRKALEMASVNMECVLSARCWLANLAYEHVIRNNESDTYYYSIVPWPGAGLSPIFKKNLIKCEYAYEKGYKPFVDMQNSHSIYLAPERFGQDNAWEYYFKQNVELSVDDIYQKENVVIPSMYIRPQKYADILKGNAREQLQELYRRTFTLQDTIKEKAQEEYERLFSKVQGKVMGCVYRGTDYQSIKPANHYIQPELHTFVELCKKYKEQWGCTHVFVATEDDEALDYFKEQFQEGLLYTNQLRYRNTGDKFLAEIHNNRENDEYLRGEEYLIAILMLAECDYLLSARNGALNAALILKDTDYEDMYLYDVGKYPATNRSFFVK